MNLFRDHPELTASFAKTDEHLENVSIIDRADDTVLGAIKRMKNLEWALLQAECRFEKEKGATDKVANEMEEFLIEINSLEGDAWTYIRAVIEQWIHYLKLHNVEAEVDDERLVSKTMKHKYKALVRNRTKSKLAFIEKNIEAAKLTKLKSNLRLPKLSKEDKQQLDELVKKSNTFALNEYKLQQSELSKLKEINSKLLLHRVENSKDAGFSNSSNKREVKFDKLPTKELEPYDQRDKLRDINIRLSEYKRDREATLEALNKEDAQLEELCKQFALHEYNMPKFEYDKIKDVASKLAFQ